MIATISKNYILEKILSDYNLFDETLHDSLLPYLNLAALITDTPIAYVSIYDKDYQYFISTKGFTSQPRPKEITVCQYTMESKDLVVIEDTQADVRTANLPTMGLQFYAGYPIVNSNNVTMGTYCVMDFKARKLSDREGKMINILGLQLTNFLERRKNIKAFYGDLIYGHKTLTEEMKKIDYVKKMLAHDLKGPIRRIKSFSSLAKRQVKEESTQLGEFINFIHNASNNMDDMLSDILNDLSAKNNNITKHIELVNINHVISTILDMNDFESKYGKSEISFSKLPIINGQKTKLFFLFQNLIENALKYNENTFKTIQIWHEETVEYYIIKVADNGIGIPPSKVGSIFRAFERAHKDQEYKGTGVGLNNVKKIVEEHGGKIWVKSTVGAGTTFYVQFPK